MMLKVNKSALESDGEDDKPMMPDVGEVIPLEGVMAKVKSYDGEYAMVEVTSVNGHDCGGEHESKEKGEPTEESVMARAKKEDEGYDE